MARALGSPTCFVPETLDLGVSDIFSDCFQAFSIEFTLGMILIYLAGAFGKCEPPGDSVADVDLAAVLCRENCHSHNPSKTYLRDR